MCQHVRRTCHRCLVLVPISSYRLQQLSKVVFESRTNFCFSWIIFNVFFYIIINIWSFEIYYRATLKIYNSWIFIFWEVTRLESISHDGVERTSCNRIIQGVIVWHRCRMSCVDVYVFLLWNLYIYFTK